MKKILFLIFVLSFSNSLLAESNLEETFFGGVKVESASKFSQSVGEIPAYVTIVTQETIEKMGFKTIADVLNFYSQSLATFYDRRYEFVVSRGFYEFEDYNTRFLVLVDGHILNEPANNSVGFDRSTPIPLELVERIEIIYGPFGVLYGTSNLQGMINIVTKKPSSMPKFFSKVSIGSFDTKEFVAGISFDANWGKFPVSGYFSASSYDSDGIRSGISRIKLSPSDPWFGPLNWDYSPIYGGSWGKRADFERAPSLFGKINIGDFTITSFWGYRKKGSPYAPWGAVYKDNNNLFKDERASVVGFYSKVFSPTFSITARCGYDDYTYFEKDTYADDTFFKGSPGYFWKDSMKTRRISLELSSLFNFDKAKYIFGGYYKREKLYENVFDEAIMGNSSYLERYDSVKQRASAFYTLGEWKIYRESTISLALNYVKYNYTKGKLIYRGSYIYPFSDKVLLKAVLGKGFRVPSYYEYGYSDSVSNLSNPILLSEDSPSYEVSLSIAPSLKQNYTISLFKQLVNDVILPVVIQDPSQIEGNVIPVGSNPNDFIGFIQYQNAEKEKINGISFGGRWFLSDYFNFYLNFTYSDTKEKEKGSYKYERELGSPKKLGNIGFLYENQKIYATFAISYIGDFLTDDGHREKPFKVSNSFDSRLNIGIKEFLHPNLRLNILVINPLNSYGKVPLSSAFIPSIGKRNDRSAIISLNYQF